jgi:steroid 5-alpha reductase family enzyme
MTHVVVSMGNDSNHFMNKIQSTIVLIVVLIVGFAVAWAGGQNTPRILFTEGFSIPLMVAATLVVFVIQWLAFIPAYIKKTEHFYDLIGGMTYVLFIGGIFVFSQKPDLRATLLTILVGIWALRLSLFLFKRVGQDGSDSRFDSIKHNFMGFLVAWTTQGLWVVITAGCAAAAISAGQKVALTFVDVAALAIWLLGFSIEVIADRQKRQFKRQKQKTNPFICQGLWRYSRHPNYFGEILLWIGLALLAFPALSGWQYITLISPLFVIFLLTKVSGIPLLEAKADQRWQDLVAYQRYKSTTPVLIPTLSRFWSKTGSIDD